jgi:hypothetical protein
MLDEGVTHVLSSKTKLRVWGREYQDDVTFLKDVELARPDVILVNEAASGDSMRILKLLSSVPSFIGVRVIFLRLCNNMIDVYDRRDEQDAVYDRKNGVIATASHDLVNAILLG